MTFLISQEGAASAHPSSVHGPELQRIATEEGVLELSIFETGLPPPLPALRRAADAVMVQTPRENQERQEFRVANAELIGNRLCRFRNLTNCGFDHHRSWRPPHRYETHSRA